MDKKSAYGTPAGDTDFRQKRDLDEYAEQAKEREAREREEAKLRYEAKLAGKRYHKAPTGDEKMATARRTVLDVRSMVGKTQIITTGAAGGGGAAGVGRRGRSAGFYCEACDITVKDNKQYVEHLNTPQHLLATGQTGEVQRATVDEVRARIQWYVDRRAELAREHATTLGERLAQRAEEARLEQAAKRQKRRDQAQRRREREQEQAALAAAKQADYGEDVRIEGEHDEDDMLAQMGITGFASKKH